VASASGRRLPLFSQRMKISLKSFPAPPSSSQSCPTGLVSQSARTKAYQLMSLMWPLTQAWTKRTGTTGAILRFGVRYPPFTSRSQRTSGRVRYFFPEGVT
jgi:hypothetical protein